MSPYPAEVEHLATFRTWAALSLLLLAGSDSALGQTILRRCTSRSALCEQNAPPATERPSAAQSSVRRDWRYRITTLEPIDHASEAWSINDTGLIGGASFVEGEPNTFSRRGTYWRSPEDVFSLEARGVFALTVLDINESGEMVGDTWRPAFHADRYQMSALPDYGHGSHGSVPTFVEKGNWRNLLLIKQVRHDGEGGLRREEGYHD